MSHNTVTLDVPNGTVTKDFFSPIAFDKEVALYTCLEGTELTPQLLSTSPLSLTMALVPGETLQRTPTTLAAFLDLGRWFLAMEAVFHQKYATYCCLEDCNFSNFLVTPTGIVGLDFERWHQGNLEQALALPLAYIQTMRCEDVALKTALFQQVFALFVAHGTDGTLLFHQVGAEVARLSARRRVKGLISKTTGAIIMGGKGQRMGGQDKSQLPLGDYTFLEHITYNMALFDTLLYSVAQPNPHVPLWGTQVVDTLQGIGPAGGLNALLQHCQSQYLFVWSCDMPFLTPDFLVSLFSTWADQGEPDGVIPQVEGRIYPLSALYNTRIKDVVSAQVEGGTRRLTQVIQGISYAVLDCPPTQSALRNINRPEDFA